jgi:tryptophan synthase beta chain
MMQAWGGNCVASPSEETQAGRDVLAKAPDTPGSLGIAISEAIEQAVADETGKTRYSLGSVLNHVMLHQTIIGLEAKKQLAKAGEKLPDVVIGCAGGGSNFAGLAFPFVADKINGAEIEIYPVEPAACPTLTRAPFAYDHGDTAGMTPLLPMHSLGHAFVPPPIHAGGLRYHGMAPLVSQAVVEGLLTPKSFHQTDCYKAAVQWARTEGFIPAPETSHALACTVDEALKAKEEGKEKVILLNWSGHGLMDLTAYQNYFEGRLEDIALPQEELDKAEEIFASYPPAEPRKSGKW